MDRLIFDSTKGRDRELTLAGTTVRYREYRGIPYVSNPVDEKYQVMNLFVPEAYTRGGSVNSYTAETAPIFLPNTVGGYMPGEAGDPGTIGFMGEISAIFYALDRGYVVASPGIRGRTLKNDRGQYTGKAPACIVDYKAAVRYLKKNSGRFPGDTEKIISNGTSAGGALSALLGSSGDDPDYAQALEELGAAEESDRIFASSCYCPILNLEHADMAYEWLFADVDEYATMRMEFENGKPKPVPVLGELTEEEKRLSAECRKDFRPYLDSLGLTAPDGSPLDEQALWKLLHDLVVRSAQRALDAGRDLSSLDWIRIHHGTVADLDFDRYLKYYRRMKTPLAFDGLKLDRPENDLFGTRTDAARHFTDFSHRLDPESGMADPEVVRRMNPMNYVGGPGTVRHWRVRHGAADRDTSLVIPVLFVAALRNKGYEVDFEMPWGMQHGGDYDLDELFHWIDSICRK